MFLEGEIPTLINANEFIDLAAMYICMSFFKPLITKSYGKKTIIT